MNIKPWILFLLLVALIFVTPTSAYAQNIVFGGASLEIGDSKDTVFSKLKYYKVVLWDEKRDMWVVDKKIPPYETLGTLQFSEDKLIWVAKNWGTYKEEVIPSILAGIFANAQGQKSYLDAKIIVSRQRQPDVESETIYFVLNDRMIELSIMRSKGLGTFVAVFENYGQYR